MPPSELSLAIASFQWDRAISLVQKDPKLAKVWTLRLGFYEGKHDSEVLPLHETCTGTAPTPVARALVQAYPDAVRLTESAYQRLALHCACRKHANSEIIALLLDVYPAATLVPDKLGRLPLHYALSNGADDVVVEQLLRAGPNSARGLDHRGWTPLHVACSSGASFQVVQRLLMLYPDAAVIRTEKGSSAAGLLDKRKAGNWKQIYSLVMHAKEEFDRRFVDPLDSEARTVDDLQIV